MSTLAVLTNQLEQLCDEIDAAQDVIPEDLLDRFADAKAAVEVKCSAYIGALRTLQHNAAFYSERADLLKRRAKTCERIEKAIKDRLLWQLSTFPDVPYKSVEGDRIALRDNPESLELKILTSSRSFNKVIDAVDADKVPAEFLDLVTVTCLNTDKLKAALKEGLKLDWAALRRGKHVRIY